MTNFLAPGGPLWVFKLLIYILFPSQNKKKMKKYLFSHVILLYLINCSDLFFFFVQNTLYHHTLDRKKRVGHFWNIFCTHFNPGFVKIRGGGAFPVLYIFVNKLIWLSWTPIDKLESAYNRSVKIMYDLPWGTHRYFLEELTGVPHISRTLVRRYLSFVSKIRSSSKVALAELLQVIKSDVRCTTGYNLRHIMLLAGMRRIEELEDGSADFEYYKPEECQAWRLSMVKEIVDIKNSEFTVLGLEENELEEILDHLCTKWCDPSLAGFYPAQSSPDWERFPATTNLLLWSTHKTVPNSLVLKAVLESINIIIIIRIRCTKSV